MGTVRENLENFMDLPLKPTDIRNRRVEQRPLWLLTLAAFPPKPWVEGKAGHTSRPTPGLAWFAPQMETIIVEMLTAAVHHYTAVSLSHARGKERWSVPLPLRRRGSSSVMSPVWVIEFSGGSSHVPPVGCRNSQKQMHFSFAKSWKRRSQGLVEKQKSPKTTAVLLTFVGTEVDHNPSLPQGSLLALTTVSHCTVEAAQIYGHSVDLGRTVTLSNIIACRKPLCSSSSSSRRGGGGACLQSLEVQGLCYQAGRAGSRHAKHTEDDRPVCSGTAACTSAAHPGGSPSNRIHSDTAHMVEEILGERSPQDPGPTSLCRKKPHSVGDLRGFHDKPFAGICISVLWIKLTP
ncbi:hypothetical protein GN956_G22894 [Arapaima gigas]